MPCLTHSMSQPKLTGWCSRWSFSTKKISWQRLKLRTREPAKRRLWRSWTVLTFWLVSGPTLFKSLGCNSLSYGRPVASMRLPRCLGNCTTLSHLFNLVFRSGRFAACWQPIIANEHTVHCLCESSLLTQLRMHILEGHSQTCQIKSRMPLDLHDDYSPNATRPASLPWGNGEVRFTMSGFLLLPVPASEEDVLASATKGNMVPHPVAPSDSE